MLVSNNFSKKVYPFSLNYGQKKLQNSGNQNHDERANIYTGNQTYRKVVRSELLSSNQI
jgi:hypothetical protein